MMQDPEEYLWLSLSNDLQGCLRVAFKILRIFRMSKGIFTDAITRFLEDVLK